MNYKYTGLVLLAVWLIIQGFSHLFDLYFPLDKQILPILNMIAGLILALYAIKMKRGEVAFFLLGCWALLQSSMFLFHYTFQDSNIIVNVLGIAAGVLLIFKL